MIQSGTSAFKPSSAFYQKLLKRNSLFWGVIIVAAFSGEMALDAFVEKLWRSNNKGKLWDDIKDNY